MIQTLNQTNKDILLKIAKESVEEFVKTGEYKDFSVTDEELKIKLGAFVTLRIKNNLRGCIGYILSDNSELWKMIRDLAIKAATEDYRFLPVKENELEKLQYEISLLSIPQKINHWKEVILGEHGVIIKKGNRSGVFLPQVAKETGWNLRELLEELCESKACLPRNCYKEDKDIELSVFTTESF